MYFGNLLVRIIYEFSLVLLLICRNTSDINTKLSKQINEASKSNKKVEEVKEEKKDKEIKENKEDNHTELSNTEENN